MKTELEIPYVSPPEISAFNECPRLWFLNKHTFHTEHFTDAYAQRHVLILKKAISRSIQLLTIGFAGVCAGITCLGLYAIFQWFLTDDTFPQSLLFLVSSVFLGAGFLMSSYGYITQQKYQILSGVKIPRNKKTITGFPVFANNLKIAARADRLRISHHKLLPIIYKQGETPSFPKTAHILELMAHCAAIEEYVGITPKGGILRYPNREFHIAYTQDAKKTLIKTLAELHLIKAGGIEPKCKHKEHNTPSFAKKV